MEMERKALTFFYATTKVMRTWHDRKKMLEMPLFPSYIFVYLHAMTDYFDAKSLDGVLGFVHFGNEVARVSDKVVSDLKFIIAHGEDLEVSSTRFPAGQQLSINQGAFSGLACEVVEHKHKRKVLVRINILNRVVLADIAATSLIA